MIVVTADEMRAMERAAVEAGAATDDELMRRAGEAVAEHVLARGCRVATVLAGPGKNGGDGLIAAERLARAGVTVHRYLVDRDVPHHGSINVSDDPEYRHLVGILNESDAIIDALLGTGQNRPLGGTLANVVAAANSSSGGHRVAVDIPTGVGASTGATLGAPFRATETITFGLPKVGNVVYPGAEFSGQLTIAGIGLQEFAPADARTTLSTAETIRARLPARAPDSNKGSFGKVLVIAGSDAYVGAPLLCSLGALRAGAGLVFAAVPKSVRTIMASQAPEVIFDALGTAGGTLGPDILEHLSSRIEATDAIVAGPGLSLVARTKQLVRALLDTGDSPAVFDADALNALAATGPWRASRPLVITPHPGEMARLLGTSIADVQANRLAAAREGARRWNAVVVLKGAGTIIATPAGQTTINSTGGPNLATGGTGDILSGVIGGLLAQGLDLADAAITGVYLHGAAADHLAERGIGAGMIAGDLLPVLPIVRSTIMEETRTQQ